ncbi:hypothetical protein OIU77_031546 [Salix suchowensis]|uniref:Uncharacterized protein n=1 Tax=Salix suchowensis TaxID=1278906 RepID=A0ABQ9BG69_9ROSI|nr:hypothetical protein OIU77_031546 [Salix suchowensis]
MMLSCLMLSGSSFIIKDNHWALSFKDINLAIAFMTKGTPQHLFTISFLSFFHLHDPSPDLVEMPSF